MQRQYRIGAATLILVLSNAVALPSPASAAVATTVTLTANPASAGWGEPVTLTATVTPVPDGGSVFFSPIGPPEVYAPVDSTGHASLTRALSCCGPLMVAANYLGTAAYAPSLGTTFVTITDDRAIPDIHLDAMPTSVTRGDTVTYTVTMSPAAPDGFIRLVGPVPSTPVFPVDPSGTTVMDVPATIDGTFETTACYSGGMDLGPVCTTGPIPITVSSIPTSTSVDVQPDAVHPNDQVTIHVAVDPPPENPTDATIVFGETARSVPVAIGTSGNGTVTVAATVGSYGRFQVGLNHIYANYPGTMRFDPSTGQVPLVVARDPVDVIVSLDSATLRPGDPLVVHVHAAPVASDRSVWVFVQYGAVNLAQDVSELTPEGSYTHTFDTSGYAAGVYRVGAYTAQTDETDTGLGFAPFSITDEVPPLVSAPQSHPLGAVGPTTSTIQTSWSATDPGSGVATIEVQRSDDGGPYVDLAVGATTKAVSQTLRYGHTYRYRVRATDNLAHVSEWVLGALVRPVFVNDASSAVHYSGRWLVQSYAGFVDGRDHWSTAARATATYTFTGRSFAWLSATGPTRGRAQVYVDGKLVATINLYRSTSRSRALLFERSWTTSHSHRVMIRVVGTGSHPRVDLDGFLILR